jgi:hypothetical protein
VARDPPEALGRELQISGLATISPGGALPRMANGLDTCCKIARAFSIDRSVRPPCLNLGY